MCKYTISMNVENTILKYIGKLNCDICGKDVADDIVGVTCCNKIYHRSCSLNWFRRNSRSK